MNIRDALKLEAKPELPGGGNPTTDAAYEKWASEFTELHNDIWNTVHFALGFPPEQLFERWHLDEHLFVTLGPGRMLPEFDYSYSHRTRWLGAYLASHPRKMTEAARLFVARRRSRAEESNINV